MYHVIPTLLLILPFAVKTSLDIKTFGSLGGMLADLVSAAFLLTTEKGLGLTLVFSKKIYFSNCQ